MLLGSDNSTELLRAGLEGLKSVVHMYPETLEVLAAVQVSSCCVHAVFGYARHSSMWSQHSANGHKFTSSQLSNVCIVTLLFLSVDPDTEAASLKANP